MLYASLHPTIVHQGDVIEGYFFTALDQEQPKIVETSSAGTEVKEPQETTFFSTDTCKLVTNFKKSKGMVITQTCDTQRRDFIQVCPVYPISTLEQDLSREWAADRIRNHLGQLRNGKLGYNFYLPEITLDDCHMEESYVDLQLVTSVRNGGISNYPRLIALSDMGRHWLSFAIMTYYGRPFSE